MSTIIIAINKMDRPDADPDRVRSELLSHELVVENLGGDILSVEVSAVQKKINVLNEWARLKGRFPQELQPLRLVIDEAKLGDRGVFYRVQAGAFGSREVAAAACDSLIGQGQACFVVVR